LAANTLGITSTAATSTFSTGGLAIGGNQFVVQQNSGWVGIGTTTPSTRFHVAGTSVSDKLQLDIGLNINPVIPDVPTVSLVAGAGNVDAGIHYYYVTYITSIGETELKTSSPSSVTTDASNGQVSVTLPTSTDYRVTGRKIYRSTAGSSYWSNVKLVATISDNSTTSYIDNIADASLTGSNYYYQENSTSQYLAVNGTQSMILSSKNTVLGYQAGATLLTTTGQSNENVLIGIATGDALTTGSKQVAVGSGALGQTTTGDSNVAIGHSALTALTTGNNNVAVGRNAGVYNKTGGYNTLVGYSAGFGVSNNSNYSYNTGFGWSVLYGITTGGYNVGLGVRSGYGLTTGAGNAFIGYQAGDNLVSGSRNIIIGYDIDATSSTAYGSLNIGNLLFGTGIDGTGTTLSTGNIGIGTTTPWRDFAVTGTVGFDGLTTNTGASVASLCLSSSNEVVKNTDNETCLTSSLRFKENISEISAEDAADVILNLHPVFFEYKDSPGLRYGLIAEEVEQIDSRLIGYDAEGRPNSVRYTSIIPILVKGFQEINKKIENLAVSTSLYSEVVKTASTTPEDVIDLLSETEGDGFLSQKSKEIRLAAGALFSKFGFIEKLFSKTLVIVPGGGITVPAGKNEMVGEGTIQAGSSDVFIENNKITSRSRVFITPLRVFDGTMALVEIKEKEGFRVGIKTNSEHDLPFSYLIIETYGGDPLIITPQENDGQNSQNPSVLENNENEKEVEEEIQENEERKNEIAEGETENLTKGTEETSKQNQDLEQNEIVPLVETEERGEDLADSTKSEESVLENNENETEVEIGGGASPNTSNVEDLKQKEMPAETHPVSESENENGEAEDSQILQEA
jgi:hypothetical protein